MLKITLIQTDRIQYNKGRKFIKKNEFHYHKERVINAVMNTKFTVEFPEEQPNI